MKKAILLSVLVLVLAACAAPATSTPIPSPTATNFTSDSGRFIVNMPSKPVPQVVTIDSPWGPVEMNTFDAVVDEVRYTVSYMDFPATAQQELLPSQQLAAVVAMIPGDLQSSETVTLDKYIGEAFRIQTEDNRLIVGRTYVVKGRVYQILAAMAPEKEQGLDLAAFFDSFRITP